MIKKVSFGLALVTLTGAGFANLVSNGSFESGFTGWSTQAAGTGSSFAIFSGGVSGAQYASFSANASQHDEIFQIVPTSAGTPYTLSFWVHNLGVGDDSLQVIWEGGGALDLSPVVTPLESWTQLSVNVLATQNGSELRFRAYDNQSAVGLDDIVLGPVPEPATIAMTAVGLALLTARRRRS